MTYKNINEILNDSFSPAIIIPSEIPTRIFYSSIRRAVALLSSQEPFASTLAGEAISFLIPNGLEFVLTFLTIIGIRAIANPLNPNYSKEEILFYLQDVKPKAILILKNAINSDAISKAAASLNIPMYEISMTGMSHFKPQKPIRKSRFKLYAIENLTKSKILTFDPVIHCSIYGNSNAANKPLVPVRRESGFNVKDIALFLHTSGTTGRPKLVPLTHKNILASIINIQNTYRLTASDATYLVMPLFHVHGLIGALLSTFISGGTVILPSKFSAQSFWDDFVNYKATWYTAVPTIHQILLGKVKETFKGNTAVQVACKIIFYEIFTLGKRAPSTLRNLENTFKVPVIEAYAMTEAAHQMTANFLKGVRKPGSVGRGRGVDVCILNENGSSVSGKNIGEVCVRGPNVISGYYNNNKATMESFHQDPVSKRYDWFRTGDLGYIDSTGFLFLVGRIKEQVNRGGEKISPIEIDQILLQHKSVAEAVAFGVPSEMYGEELEAAVVLKPGEKATEDQLKEFLKQKLIEFKIPRRIYIVESLAKTATGKIQRRMIADVFMKSKSKL